MDKPSQTTEKGLRMSTNWIAYDGQCPFCTKYVHFIRIKEAAGPIDLINARQNPGILDELVANGFDIDEGIALKLNGQYHHGDDCMTTLVLLSTPSNLFNRVNAIIT